MRTILSGTRGNALAALLLPLPPQVRRSGMCSLRRVCHAGPSRRRSDSMTMRDRLREWGAPSVHNSVEVCRTPLALKLLDVSLARTIVSSESFAAAELVY